MGKAVALFDSVAFVSDYVSPFDCNDHPFEKLIDFISRIFLLKQLLAWYFQRKVNKNSGELSDLRQEKKKMIEQVMDKETYKVALEILNKFGDKMQPQRMVSTGELTPRPAISKSTNMTPKSAPIIASQAITPRGTLNNNPNTISTLQQRLNTPVNQNRSFVQAGYSSQQVGDNANRIQHLVPSVRSSSRTPYPIIDSSRKGVLDKMVDYLIGDGPSNRFAMICKECYRHNG